LRNHIVADGGGVSALCGPVRPGAAAALAVGLGRLLAHLGDPVAVVVDDSPATLRSLRIRSESLRAVTDAVEHAPPDAEGTAEVTICRMPTGARATAEVAALTRSYRHIVVAFAGTPDARACAVAHAADRVLVYSERRRTRVRDLRVVVRRLRLARARVTMALLIGADRSRLWPETGDLLQ
jgi:hypothetical protein